MNIQNFHSYPYTCEEEFSRIAAVTAKYVGGPKRNWKRSLVGGPVVVHASAARCLLRGPFCITLPTGIVEWSRGAT